MRKHVLLWLAAAALLFSVSAGAQVAVTANVKTLLQASVSSRAYFQVKIQNCSPGPSVDGVVLDSNPERNQYPVTSNGTASFTLYRNDSQISCAGAFVSFTTIELWSSGKKVWSKNFYFQDAAADLSTYAEYLTTPPSAADNYAIRNGGNNFTGVQNFTAATVIGLSGEKPRRFLPSGTIDGANKDFVFGAFPDDHAMFSLYLNGVLLSEDDDYTVSGTTVTMTSAPKSGDKLFAYF